MGVMVEWLCQTRATLRLIVTRIRRSGHQSPPGKKTLSYYTTALYESSTKVDREVTSPSTETPLLTMTK